MKYSDEEFNRWVKQFHKVSSRHVLTVELSLTEDELREIFAIAERGRKYSNRLTSILNKKLKVYERDTRIVRIKKNLKQAYKTNDAGWKISLFNEMNSIRDEYGLTEFGCTKLGTSIYKDFNIPSIYRCTLAEDVYRGVNDVLYGEGKKLHFRKRFDLPSIRAKEINTFIILKCVNSELCIDFMKMRFHIKFSKLTDFDREELNLVAHYMENSEIVDRYAVEQYQKDKTIVDTFRPCYITLVPKVIRGKKRVFANITIEGNALPKKNADGTLKHKLGEGVIGVDVGTQSVAYTTEDSLGMFNLAERGESIRKRERWERIIKRKMDRSIRANNPNNYKDDGTVKEGAKKWVKSNRYRKLQAQYRNISRIASENRHFAINESVNRLRSISSEVHIEEKNAKELQQRVEVVTEDGKVEHHKNHGKSIQNRCGGYFQQQLKNKYERTGGTYTEVNNVEYRASQYNHILDAYVPKDLNVRMYELSDDIVVQRDLYSSLLLYCMATPDSINKELVREMFPEWFRLLNEFISRVKRKKIVLLNSGI